MRMFFSFASWEPVSRVLWSHLFTGSCVKGLWNWPFLFIWRKGWGTLRKNTTMHRVSLSSLSSLIKRIKFTGQEFHAGWFNTLQSSWMSSTRGKHQQKHVYVAGVRGRETGEDVSDVKSMKWLVWWRKCRPRRKYSVQVHSGGDVINELGYT